MFYNFKCLSLSNSVLVFRAGIHKMLARIANREDWVCTVCLGLFSRHLVFEILAHLPVLQFSGVMTRAERCEYELTSFGEKNFPLDYFVGHKHGRMFSCQ